MFCQRGLITSRLLANLVFKDYSLRVSFGFCGLEVNLDVDEMVPRHGEGLELPEIEKLARCRECGGKGASVQVVAVVWK